MYQYLICQTNTKIRGGKVRVELGDSCFKKNVLVHEMMHVLGFGHEHQRADRDCYVFVDYKEGKKIWVKLTLYFFNLNNYEI